MSQLVDELTRFGIAVENIHLQGVHIETSSGELLKSSSAIYRLRVRCDALDQIAELLDIITSQKNAALERIDWKYDEDEARADLNLRWAKQDPRQIKSLHCWTLRCWLCMASLRIHMTMNGHPCRIRPWRWELHIVSQRNPSPAWARISIMAR